jgi:putative glutamine amidotransferase
VRAAGGLPILISPDLAPDTVADLCDGIVISGGDDLPPELYGESLNSPINPESSERIKWEQQLLDLFTNFGKPVLGVCYGLQLINVHFGGTLHQQLPTPPSNPVDHGAQGQLKTHIVRIETGSCLFPLLGGSVAVSSNHHQGIKAVAPGFSVVATAPDNLIEAIHSERVMAVEWHPESDQTGSQIYSLLVDWAREERV